jgi:hypothetical protein
MMPRAHARLGYGNHAPRERPLIRHRLSGHIAKIPGRVMEHILIEGEGV